jgi:phosphatidylinositol-3-phosphatase
MKKYFCLITVCAFLTIGRAFSSTIPHVVIVVEENRSYSSVIGSNSAPYINNLANTYGLMTNYYGNTHPSIGNYFMMTVGRIVTNNDSFTGTYSDNNIVRQLQLAGKTWKVYAEDLPSVGYIGGDTGNYTKHHNPFAYLTDVINSSVERQNIVPFTQFAVDLANNNLPHYAFVVPNNLHNSHDGSLQAADTWLKNYVAVPLLANIVFKAGGILIVTFDESTSTDKAYGGGHIVTIVAGPNAYHTKNATLLQHQSLLRLTCNMLGIYSNLPGLASGAPPISGMIRWP